MQKESRLCELNTGQPDNSVITLQSDALPTELRREVVDSKIKNF